MNLIEIKTSKITPKGPKGGKKGPKKSRLKTKKLGLYLRPHMGLNKKT